MKMNAILTESSMHNHFQFNFAQGQKGVATTPEILGKRSRKLLSFLFLETNWYIDAATNSPETVEKQLRFQMPHTPLKTLRGKVPQTSLRNQSVTDKI